MADSFRSNSSIVASYHGQPCLVNLASASVMRSPFRLDEGYSEETRSQSGYDTVPRTDSRMSEMMEQDPGHTVLPDWIRNLSEVDRSGKLVLASALLLRG